MDVLRLIDKKAAAASLRFLVIGGHAVNAYNVQRSTGDIDLLISRSEEIQWKRLLESLKYKPYHKHDVFIQFAPPVVGSWPIDLMIVDSEIFEKLYANSTELEVGIATVRVPSIEHLIALKLHAYKREPVHRLQKDFHDIVQLAVVNNKDPHKQEFKDLCLKYVTIEQYEKICRAIDEVNKQE